MTDGPDRPARAGVVDAHHHVWDLAVRDQPWTADLPPLRRSFGIEELQPQLEAAGVDGTVVVETVNVPEETPELLALAEASPSVVGVVGWVDLTGPDVADRVADLRAAPGGHWLVGLRHGVQGEPDPRWLLRPDVTRGLAEVGAAGLVFDLLVTADQLPAAVEVVRALPDVPFVLDHAGKPPIASGPLDAWREHLDALAGAPNVVVKLSGLVTEAAADWVVDDLRRVSDHVLDRFGADRTMFGSDWPVCTLRGSYEEMLDITEWLLSGASVAERAAVLGRTAQRSYGLAAGPAC